jgi:hypothetical protein
MQGMPTYRQGPKPSARWGIQSALRCQGVSVSAKQPGPLILVVENVEEIRDGIEKRLAADGYRVEPARQQGLPCKDRRATSPG